MFREIRKKKNAITDEEVKAILKKSRRGILAVNGDDGYPYAIPVNYLYDEKRNIIVFHGSGKGHKVDALKTSDKVCFTVCGDEVIREEAWAPFVRSAVVFGKCHIIEDKETAKKELKAFAMKYYPQESMVDDEIAATGNAVKMFEIDIEHMRGKEVQER